MVHEEIYAIAKLATQGRDIANRIWWLDDRMRTADAVEQIEDIFKEILKQIEEIKNNAAESL